MSVSVNAPGFLLLLPLALLPLIFIGQRAEPYPSTIGIERDWLSVGVDWALRLLAACAIAALIVGIAGLHRLGLSIERLGQGANIVLLFDRSSSMDNTFAGSVPTGNEDSKSAAARRFLTQFVATREHDRFGVAAFSTAPMFVLPLTDHKDAVQAAIDAIDLPGLAYTNVAKGLAMALSMHESDIRALHGRDEGLSSRAIVLVSDGAAVIDRKVQDQLRAAFNRRPIRLYWIFLRTESARGIFDLPKKGDIDRPQAMPERHLNLFFQSLQIPYRAFEAENPQAVGEAIAAIDQLERSPIRYLERVPQEDLSAFAYGAAAVALFLLILAKLAETRLAATARPVGSRGASLTAAFLALMLLGPSVEVGAAELDRAGVMAIIAAEDEPDLSRRDLSKLDLSGIDFKQADLFAAEMSEVNLANAKLAGVNFNRAILRRANLSGADLSGANLFAVVMDGADLTGADLSRSRIIGELKNVKLTNAKLVGADLGADPTNQGMVPVRTDLSGATLQGADLTGANLTHVLLDYANLRDANLTKARFNWAKLSGADLSGATVNGTFFHRADLTGAILNDLKDADKAVGLNGEGGE